MLRVPGMSWWSDQIMQLFLTEKYFSNMFKTINKRLISEFNLDLPSKSSNKH